MGGEQNSGISAEGTSSTESTANNGEIFARRRNALMQARTGGPKALHAKHRCSKSSECNMNGVCLEGSCNPGFEGEACDRVAKLERLAERMAGATKHRTRH